jgi:hypothetical protein
MLFVLFLFQINTDKSVSAFPEGESLFKWIGTISGPKGTVSTVSIVKLSNTIQSIHC